MGFPTKPTVIMRLERVYYRAIGTEIITNTSLGVPYNYYNYNILGPKTRSNYGGS